MDAFGSIPLCLVKHSFALKSENFPSKSSYLSPLIHLFFSGQVSRDSLVFLSSSSSFLSFIYVPFPHPLSFVTNLGLETASYAQMLSHI